MKKKLTILYLLIFLGLIIIPTLAFAQRSTQDILTRGLILPPSSGGIYEISDLLLLLAAVLRLIFTASAVVAVVYVILGGYAYVTAYGNPESIQKGKQTLTWAIIGLIISIAAFMIVQFVWNAFASNRNQLTSANKANQSHEVQNHQRI